MQSTFEKYQKLFLFDLMLYVHDEKAEVMSGRSVILTTLFLGRLLT